MAWNQAHAANCQVVIKEIIKEVPVEVRKEVLVPVEVIKKVEVIKEVPVVKEVVREVPVEKVPPPPAAAAAAGTAMTRRPPGGGGRREGGGEGDDAAGGGPRRGRKGPPAGPPEPSPQNLAALACSLPDFPTAPDSCVEGHKGGVCCRAALAVTPVTARPPAHWSEDWLPLQSSRRRWSHSSK